MAVKLNLLTQETIDEEFDTIYPADILRLSVRHWTPIQVARQAAIWLVQKKGDHILDIGSGAGKFCFVGALTTQGYFTGVEKTKKLVDVSRKIQKRHQINNVQFLNNDLKNIDLSLYKGFYFYNAFHELILEEDSIENPALIAEQQYYDYSNYLYEKLESMPIKTRLVTYYGQINQVPNNYTLLDSAFEDELKLWEKKAG